MYSGWLITDFSGHFFGAHQKVDRVARKHLDEVMRKGQNFPKIRSILHFEGRGGPDGIKIKSPAQDEPWHFFNPFNTDDAELLNLIEEHYKHLVNQLKANNKERSAFEAAWLSHALVDGLTPAHHYPYEEKLIELMGGQSLDTRTTLLKKNFVPGGNIRGWVKNNWRMWGPKGLRMGHALFEMGVATLIAPLGFGETEPSKADIKLVKELGVMEFYKRTAKEIAVLGIFDRYVKRGWTPRLAWQVRNKLGPAMIQVVTLFWYAAAEEAARNEGN